MSGLSSHGYVRISINSHRRYEHRVVAERMLGRPLASHEYVHHRDGDRTNNDPANLEVLSQRRHMREHYESYREKDGEWEHRCSKCGKWLPLTSFRKTRAGRGTASCCKACASAEYKKWYDRGGKEYHRQRRRKQGIAPRRLRGGG